MDSSLPPPAPVDSTSTHLAPAPSRLTPLFGTALTYLFLFSLATSTRFMPFLTQFSHSPILGLAGAFLTLGPFTLLQVLLVRYIAAWQDAPLKRFLWLLVSGVAWVGLIALSESMRGGAGVVLGGWLNLALIATTVLTGAFISLAIKEVAVLLPVLIVSAIVDFWGVYYGTTHMFVKNAPHLVERVSAQVPTVTFGGVPVSTTTIGPGDFVFLGIFFACLYRFDTLNVGRTFWAFFVLLLISLLLVTVFAIPIPGLVPMAIALLAVNWKAFRMSRAEIFATVYVILFLVLALVGLTVFGPFRK